MAAPVRATASCPCIHSRQAGRQLGLRVLRRKQICWLENRLGVYILKLLITWQITGGKSGRQSSVGRRFRPVGVASFKKNTVMRLHGCQVVATAAGHNN